MAFNLGDIVATLKANTTQFVSGIETAKRKIDDIKKSNDQLNDSAKKAIKGLESQIDNMRKGADRLKGVVTQAQKGIAQASVVAAGAVYGIVRGFKDAIDQANKYNAAMIGLSSVTRAFGVDTQKARQAAEDLSADGLMTITDSATSLKNLLMAGFGLDQAVTLMNRFKDSAAFARQGSLSFGEAIRGATEGIKNGNSILVDNAGVTKNLSIMLEEAGYSAQDLMKASTDAGVRQAIFNGIIRETNAQVGDAKRLTDDAAGAQAKFSASAIKAQQAVGNMLRPMLSVLLGILQPLIDKVPQFSGTIVAAAGAVLVVSTAFLGLVTAMKAVILLSNPIMMVFALIASLAGVRVFNAIQNLQTKFKDTGDTFKDTADEMGKGSANVGQGIGEMSDETVKKLQDIDDQIVKTKENYLDNLAEIIDGHRDKLKSLQDDLADENASYAKSSKKQEKDNQKKLSSMEEDHKRATKSILDDIAEEEAKGIEASGQRIKDLRDRLDQENYEYQKAKREQLDNYTESTADAKAQHEERTSDLKKQIDIELEYLKKHEAAVAEVKDVARLDDIEKLKKQTADRLAEYEKDKQNAVSQGNQKVSELDLQNAQLSSGAEDTANAISKAFDNMHLNVAQNLSDLGINIDNFGQKFTKVKDSLVLGMEAIVTGIVAVRSGMLIQTGLVITKGLTPLAAALSAIPASIVIGVAVMGALEVIKQLQGLKKELDGLDKARESSAKLDESILAQAKAAKEAGNMDRYNRLMDIYKKSAPESSKLNWFQQLLLGVDSFATGVTNFKGGLAYVHQGEVLANLPPGTDVIPKKEVEAAVGASGNNTYNLSFNGVMVRSSSEFRDLIMQGIQEVDRSLKANGKPSILKG